MRSRRRGHQCLRPRRVSVSIVCEWRGSQWLSETIDRGNGRSQICFLVPMVCVVVPWAEGVVCLWRGTAGHSHEAPDDRTNKPVARRNSFNPTLPQVEVEIKSSQIKSVTTIEQKKNKTVGRTGGQVEMERRRSAADEVAATSVSLCFGFSLN